MAKQPEESNVSTPKKRIRWATQRVKGASGGKKRHHIMERLHRRTVSGEKKGEKASRLQNGGTAQDGSSEEIEDHDTAQRRVFFNIPLPDDAKDEEGRPRMKFGRNKIRTAKYTPLSFVPKNLYFQFHNIANIYFFFLIILGVSIGSTFEFPILTLSLLRYSQSLAIQTQL